MIKVENIDVWGFEHAVRGMRNPLNSWDKSDSRWEWVEDDSAINPNDPGMCFIIGDNDLGLMQRLYTSGPEHRKYLRQIIVSLDITAPLYWWKEFDTYKVGTVANSCSTMHKIAAKEFELNDFSWEQLLNTRCDLFTYEWENGKFSNQVQPLHFLVDFIIPALNTCREKYLETKDKNYWWQMIQLLPTSYNQKRTVTMNYENVITMIKQRTNHKLTEWEDFCIILKELPYIKEIMEV